MLRCSIKYKRNTSFRFDQESQGVRACLEERWKLCCLSRFREQNDRSFWGKNFPKFAVKENRLYNREEFVDAAEKVEEFDLDNISELSFEKQATEEEILRQATNKKYSTFDLYSDDEFKESLNSFKNWLKGKINLHYTAEIGEIIFKKV